MLDIEQLSPNGSEVFRRILNSSPDSANEILALMLMNWCHFSYLKQMIGSSSLSLPLCDYKQCTIHPEWMYVF